MLTILDQALTAMKRDHDRRLAPSVAEALCDACPERFVEMDFDAACTHAQNWLDYVAPFDITFIKNVVALYILWDQWLGFDDRESAWIVEILRGPLHEDEKIGSLYELLY